MTSFKKRTNEKPCGAHHKSVSFLPVLFCFSWQKRFLFKRKWREPVYKKASGNAQSLPRILYIPSIAIRMGGGWGEATKNAFSLTIMNGKLFRLLCPQIKKCKRLLNMKTFFSPTFSSSLSKTSPDFSYRALGKN